MENHGCVERYCPICGKDNQCGNLPGTSCEACWCTNEFFPSEIFHQLQPDQLRKACICRDCLNKFKKGV